MFVGGGCGCCGCAPCPDLEQLCIAITLTDYNGTVYTADQDDIIWFGGGGAVYFSGFDYTVLITCDVSNEPGGITISVGWAGVIANCVCTSGNGADTLECSSADNWYIGTASGTIEFENTGVPCDNDCPPDLGSYSVTFSDPPC